MLKIEKKDACPFSQDTAHTHKVLWSTTMEEKEKSCQEA